MRLNSAGTVRVTTPEESQAIFESEITGHTPRIDVRTPKDIENGKKILKGDDMRSIVRAIDHLVDSVIYHLVGNDDGGDDEARDIIYGL